MRYSMSFGENLKHNRTTAGLNQKQLALLLNTSQQHISQLENNLREPSLNDLRQLSAIFKLPTDFLIQDSPTSYNIQDLNIELEQLLHALSHEEKFLIRDLLVLVTHRR